MKIWKIALILGLIAGLSGLLIATVNHVTKDIIAENELAEKNKLVEEFFETVDKDKVEWVDVDNYNSIDNKTIVKDANGNELGVIYVASGTNSYGDISLVVAIDNEDKVIGVKYLALNQTPGFGDKVNTDEYKGKYVGLNANNINVDAVSGATYSSNLVSKLVKEVGYAHLGLEIVEPEKTEVPLYWFGILGALIVGGPIVIWKVGGRREQK